MKYRILFAILFAVFLWKALPVLAQQQGPNIAFEIEIYDFGKIKEDDGKVTCRFDFVNTGNAPLIINNVRTSCGCTSPGWTKNPILPGNKGYVEATYDPSHRPGAFQKTIMVQTNSEITPQKILKIKGDVIPRPETLVERYRADMGDLRLRTAHAGFGRIFLDQKSIKTIEFVNFNEKDNLTLDFINVPDHINVEVQPTLIKPRETGKITITYDASEIDDWGMIVSRVGIIVNGKTKNEYRLMITANRGEDFSKLTQEQRRNAPKLKFDTTVYNFGTITEGQVINHNFTYTNTGKSDLVFRKIKSTCGCTVVNQDTKVVKPGEKGSLKVTFNSQGKKGAQTQSVLVICNDPVNTVTRLYIRGTVEKK
jgi:hypothetical protein